MRIVSAIFKGVAFFVLIELLFAITYAVMPFIILWPTSVAINWVFGFNSWKFVLIILFLSGLIFSILSYLTGLLNFGIFMAMAYLLKVSPNPKFATVLVWIVALLDGALFLYNFFKSNYFSEAPERLLAFVTVLTVLGISYTFIVCCNILQETHLKNALNEK